jgi:hypothetical protein
MLNATDAGSASRQFSRFEYRATRTLETRQIPAELYKGLFTHGLQLSVPSCCSCISGLCKGMLSETTRAYFSEIGRKGGRKSRRKLSPAQARHMVGLKQARAAFHRFYNLCFWSSPENLVVTSGNAPWVVEQLRRNGNRAAWQAAARIEVLISCR